MGIEDGAHKITADVFQALNDAGFSLPAQAAHLASLLTAQNYPAE